MDHAPHQVVADDVVIDGRQRLAGAKEALVGGTELTVRSVVVFTAADDVDQPVVKQREQRRQLRHHGVIVVAGIRHQRFGEGDANACDAAVDTRHVLGAGPRDVAKRAAGLGLVLLPAHSPKPQLGSPVVVRCVERIDVRRSDRTAAKQGFQSQRRAAGVGCATATASRNRKRDRRVHQIMRHELQQISVARGNERIFPVLRRSPVVRPMYPGIHPPRQALHQSAQLR